MAMSTDREVLNAAQTACNAWSTELQRLFGKRAGDVRYTAQGRGAPGSHLRACYEAFKAAQAQAFPSPNPETTAFVNLAAEHGATFYQPAGETCWRWRGPHEDNCRDWRSLDIAAREFCAHEGVEP